MARHWQKHQKQFWKLPHYKTFFMLNSSEHEIFSANKYENANKSSTMINPQWLEQPTEQISMVPKMLEVRLYV